MGNRHLALAESPDLDLVLELVEPAGEAIAKLALVDDHLELTLQTADGGLADLHDICLNRRVRSDRPDRALRHNLPRPATLAWCGRRDSNPHDLRHRNLNPARLPVPPRPRALQRLAPRPCCGGGEVHASTLPPRNDGRAFGSACSRMGGNFKRTGVRSRRS